MRRSTKKNPFRIRLQKSFLFRAQAIFFGRLAIYCFYFLLFILSLTNSVIKFPHNTSTFLFIFSGFTGAFFCFKFKNHKKYGRWFHLVTLFLDLFIHIYITKNSHYLFSPFMALHPLFTLMFLVLFHNPLIISAPLLAVPIATFMTLWGGSDPPFVAVLSHLLLFCTLDALSIFFIQLVQSREQRLMHSLVKIEKKLRDLAILKERQRFAQDFHDGIGAQLTSVIMQVDYMQLALDPNLGIHADLNEIKTGALASIDDMRRSIAFLREDFDVAEQVALLCENMRDRHHIRIETFGIYHLADLKPEQQVACCRVVQEGLMNALKHAQASLITVRCVRDHGIIKLSIEDNGLGFALDTNRRHHYGLTNMHDRARQIGGALAIVSELNCGTQVELSVPC